MPAIARILVGWDGSADARRALRFATHLGTNLHAEVTAVAVLKRPAHIECPDEAAEHFRSRRLEIFRQMDTVFESAGRSSVSYHREAIDADVDPATELTRYADEHAFDLLIVGRHGVDGAVHPRLGRVTGHLVASSHCPVVVVPGDPR